MGFGKSLKRIATGAATGGLSEVARALSPSQQTATQVPLETAEQAQARKMLLDFAKTGAWGNYSAGQDIGITRSDFKPTVYETQGLSNLEKLIGSEIPEQYRMGNTALKDLLNPDPNFIQSQFDPFKAQIERQITDSTTAAKRNAAYTGNLYSSSAIKSIGDVQARGNETLTAQLANLTNEALNRRLQAIPLAFEAGKAEEDINLGRIDASQRYGGLERNLANSAIAEENAEKLRRRSEIEKQIAAAMGVSGQNANFGVPSVTTSTPSPYMDFLNLAANIGGRFVGSRGAG